jgi:hypothetical protein
MYKSVPDVKNNRRIVFWGVILGILPDFISFVPVMLVRFIEIIRGNVEATFLTDAYYTYAFADYGIISYNYTHSILIWLLATLLIWAGLKKFPWILLGWGLHIVIDIFSHTTDFFATPFLFPFSNFQISVVNWSHPIFMLVNYALLLVLYIFFIPRTKARP